VWDYVALGSVNCGNTYPELYAAHNEADLGVRVVLHNRCRLLKSPGELVQVYRSSEAMQAEISEAEVVTLWPGGEDDFTALTSKSVDCEPEVEAFEEELDAVIVEIPALRENGDTIVRLRDHYLWVNSLTKRGVLDEKKDCHEAINELIHEVGSRHGICVAGVSEAFNGPSGLEDPGEKGYLGYDGYRVSPDGDAVLAELLRELGYEPTVP
jgi:hypothetical protein